MGSSALQHEALQRESDRDYVGKHLCLETGASLSRPPLSKNNDKGDTRAFSRQVCRLSPSCGTQCYLNATDSGLSTQ